MQPNFDLEALRAVVTRAIPTLHHPVIEPASGGGSTTVYRVRVDKSAWYLRLSTDPAHGFQPEVDAHALLRAKGVRVPEVIQFLPFEPVLGCSFMLTSEICGEPIAAVRSVDDARQVAVRAGHDLALINSIPVAGFGWIRRDRPANAPLTGMLPSLRAFALAEFDADLAVLAGLLSQAEARALSRVIAVGDAWLDGRHAGLAHGDFDVSHIYQLDGQYSGIIDFGEIRGTDPWYDLGHFALHDGEYLPMPLLPALLEGYGAVTVLPADHHQRIRFWSLLIGVRTLARISTRPPTPYRTFLIHALRRLMAESIRGA